VQALRAALGLDPPDEVLGVEHPGDVLGLGEAQDAAGQVAHAVADLQPVEQYGGAGAQLLAGAADAARSGGLAVAAV
jgi:hypothetical protein